MAGNALFFNVFWQNERAVISYQYYRPYVARNVNFDTMLPAVIFSVAGNIFILGGNTIPGMVTGQSRMVTRLRSRVTYKTVHGNIMDLRPFGRNGFLLKDHTYLVLLD